jgi:hypothetical protein
MILGYRSRKMSIRINYKRQRRKVFFASGEYATRASIFIALAILAANALALVSLPISTMTIITTAFAQGENNSALTPTSNNNYPVTTITATSEIDLSPQPVYQDQVRGVRETQINQTHTLSTVAGNGTLTLPNTTEPISTTSSGNLIVSLEGTVATAAGEQIVITEDGSESATATLYEIARFNM